MSRPLRRGPGTARRHVNTRVLAASTAVIALALAGCGSGDNGGGTGGSSTSDDLFPAKGIRMIVASSAGGGFDRASRQVQAPMQKVLGTKLNIEYQSSAGGAVAMSLLQKAPDCNTMVVSANPKVVLSQFIQKVDYSYEKDFASLGGFTRDYAVLMTRPDSKYHTLQDLVDAAKADPKGVNVAVGTVASDGKAVVALQDAAGVEFNIVPFGGGTEANNALLGGKVDIAESSVFNSLNLKGKVKVLGVLADTNPIPDQTGNAPTANEALGVDMPQQVNNYGLFVSSACKSEHPEAYAALSKALENALDDADFTAAVEKLGLTGWYTYTPAEQYDQEIIDQLPELEKFVTEQNLAP